MKGARAGGRKRENSRCTFVLARAGTNVLTFVQGGGSERYKCAALTFVPILTGTNVLASHLYRSEPPPGTNVRHLYRVDGRRRQRAL
jgi:hypothetical protein